MSLQTRLATVALATAAAGCTSTAPAVYYPPYEKQQLPLANTLPDTSVVKQQYTWLASNPAVGRCWGEQHVQGDMRLQQDVVCSTSPAPVAPRRLSAKQRRLQETSTALPAFNTVEVIEISNRFNAGSFTNCDATLVLVDPTTHRGNTPVAQLVHGPRTLNEFGGYTVPEGMAAITSPVSIKGQTYNNQLDCRSATVLTTATLQLAPTPSN